MRDKSKTAGENVHLEISENFGVDKALKKFKRLCDTFGVVKEYRDREYYQKPSIKSRLKRENAQKRKAKTLSKSKISRKF
ncbi:MAG: 30S ribosomal protein S21 [Proteobacteria bacterium]|jgi:small subunit ribosomal protein S21|nr:30S ribosomal protein S21 [Pseudomonadota bacterium]